MITILDGILTIPEDERFVGFSGDNLHTQKKFLIRSAPQSGWIYRLYLTFDDGRHNFFILPATVSSEGTSLTWDIEEGHIFKSGIVEAQIKAFSEDEEVYHTTSDVFIAGESTEEDEEFKNSNSEFLNYEKTLNELYTKMQNASAKMPYVGENGNWYIYDIADDSYIDSGISSVAAVKNGSITPEKLSQQYWIKQHFSVIISDYRSLFNSIKTVDNGGSICYANLDIQSGAGLISGYCQIFGVTENTGNIRMYITNVANGSFWTIVKEKDAEAYTATHLTDGRYLKKTYTSLGEQITSFSELFAKIGYISIGGNIGVVNLWVSDNDTDTVNEYGYINGEFLAVGSPTHTSGNIYLRNLSNGECWIVCHNDDNTYYAYKVDVLTPRVEHLESTSKLTVIGTFNAISEMQAYSFAKDRLYHFRVEGAAGALLGGQGYCYGRYYESTDPETNEVNAKMLEVFNSSTLTVYELNLTEGTAQLMSNVSAGTNGKSAYEVAVENGFEGTEEDWLLSLKGTDGEDGYTPQKGTDYYTEADKAEIVSAVIESLGGNPIFGYVDENNNIVVSGNLADGSYSVKYEMEDGSTVDIGNLELDTEESDSSDAPAYTNLLPLSVDTDGSDYAGTHENGGDGYEYGYRISHSSGSQTAQDNVYCSGFIPATLNDVMRIKGIAAASTDTHNVIAFYNESKERVNALYMLEGSGGVAIDGDFYTIQPNQSFSTSFAFFRFSCGSITDETIVTVNEEIV